jgi:dihydroorotate dehydrogenase
MTPRRTSDFYGRWVRPPLFALDAERAHRLTARLAAWAAALPPLRAALRRALRVDSPLLVSTLAGLESKAPLGIAAGLDKDATLYPFLAACGFGHVESGTFTTLAQVGNPRPRLFRVVEREAIVNRMGFNNPGAEAVARRVARQRRVVPRGLSIGKSKLAADPIADALESLVHLAPLADYVAINVSSPNTPGLRDLQAEPALRSLFAAVRRSVRERNPNGRVFVKLAPDLADAEIDRLVDVGIEIGVDALILTNTTLDRSQTPEARELAGGLSGAPLRARSTAVVRRAFRRSEGRLPIVGVGGIFDAADALEKIRAGATWLQAYTGFVYRGPTLARDIHRGLLSAFERAGSTLRNSIGSDA